MIRNVLFFALFAHASAFVSNAMLTPRASRAAQPSLAPSSFQRIGTIGAQRRGRGGGAVPPPPAEKSAFKKYGSLVFFSGVPIIIGSFFFEKMSKVDAATQFEILKTSGLTYALVGGAVIGLCQARAVSQGRSVFTPPPPQEERKVIGFSRLSANGKENAPGTVR